ncbi:MAG TPA: S8 family serine peptidase [Candidatus Cybelea sp.]|jgi:subtilase family serine protease
MKLFEVRRYGFSSVAAFVISLAGCSGAQSPIASFPLPAVNDPAGALSGLSPACSGSRIGHAQCDLLIPKGGALPMYSGWSASQLERAYHLPISRGAGQTVFIVDAYDNPRVESDFREYRSTMGLPAGKLNKFNQEGQRGNYPPANRGWGAEIDIDVDMVSASCPKCTVDLIEADTDLWLNLELAEREAVKLGATIVSNSFSGRVGGKSYFDAKGVTYLASAGDSGIRLIDPATFASVVAVGGTELTAGGGRRGFTETIWPNSGGGCSSTGVAKPPWQLKSIYGQRCPYRHGVDLSAIAANVEYYDTYQNIGWTVAYGTSIGTPFCAGIFALAGNATQQTGGKTFWMAAHHPYLNRVGGVRYTSQGGFGSPNGIGAF